MGTRERAEALSRLDRALGETVILGVDTNVSFLRALLNNSDVANGQLDTGLIERTATDLLHHEPIINAFATCALVHLLHKWPQGAQVNQWDVPSGWRPGEAKPLSFSLLGPDGRPMAVTIVGSPSNALVRVGSNDPLPSTILGDADGYLVTIGDVALHAWGAIDGSITWVFVDGNAWSFTEEAASRREAWTGQIDGQIRSPMPGTVTLLSVAQGGHVHEGDALVVIEAMKMQHVLVAPCDGSVEILVQVGDPVRLNDVVARVLEPKVGSVALQDFTPEERSAGTTGEAP